MNIFIGHKFCHFVIARVRSGFLKSLWQIFLPVRVDHIVAQVLEQLDFSLRPFVKVDGFDLGDVHSKLSVYARASDAHETPESNRGPPRNFAGAIYAVFVVWSLEKLFKNFGLLIDVHFFVIINYEIILVGDKEY